MFIVVLICFGVTAFFYYPETRGLSLERIALIFDGEDAVPDAQATAKTALSNVHEKSDAIVVSESVHKEEV